MKILYKKKKLFVKYKGNWLNVNHEVLARGGGIKGFLSFICGINKCRKGNHTYHTYFDARDFTSHVRCCYCGKEKE
jgi:hypothetical protein